MTKDRPSQTAWWVAMRRADHQVLDLPLVFEDPLALRMVGADEASVRSTPQGHRRIRKRAFLAARSRFAEDRLAAAISGGMTQYVVLGAGLDTFAYRNPWPALQILEVDFPATQKWKKELLGHAGIAVPQNVSFVPVDFEHELLADRLRSAGFRDDRRAFFSWLGVVPYLTSHAFDSTLRMIGALPGGSCVVFDYTVARAALRLRERIGFAWLSNRVAKVGEPFQLLLKPDQLVPRLSAFGFTQIEDLGPDQLTARYFRGRTDDLGITSGLGRVILAVC